MIVFKGVRRLIIPLFARIVLQHYAAANSNITHRYNGPTERFIAWRENTN